MEAAESLFVCLERVKDPRKAHGVRHPSRSILKLTLRGLVCGRTGTARIALFVRMYWLALREPLGFFRASRGWAFPRRRRERWRRKNGWT